MCGQIDQSNCHQQATLKLEHKFKVHDCRVKHSIFGMSIVYTWLVLSQCTQTEEDQGAFYEYMALETIDNSFDLGAIGGTRMLCTPRQSIASSLMSDRSLTGAIVDLNRRGRSGVRVHLTLCKRYRRRSREDLSKQRAQGKCRVWCKIDQCVLRVRRLRARSQGGLLLSLKDQSRLLFTACIALS
jgi:hypothetical protein